MWVRILTVRSSSCDGIHGALQTASPTPISSRPDQVASVRLQSYVGPPTPDSLRDATHSGGMIALCRARQFGPQLCTNLGALLSVGPTPLPYIRCNLWLLIPVGKETARRGRTLKRHLKEPN